MDPSPQNTKTPQPLRDYLLGWPGTRIGWVAFVMLIAFLVFFTAFLLLVESGQRGGETFFSNPWLAATFLSAAVSAILGGFFALIAILWQQERSLLAFLSLIWGILVAVFVLMEFLYPH